MCKYAKTTIRYKCHDVVYTELSECEDARHNRGCHDEHFEEIRDEPHKFCKSCIEEREDCKRATAETDREIAIRALNLMNMGDEGKDETYGEYIDKHEDSTRASKGPKADDEDDGKTVVAVPQYYRTYNNGENQLHGDQEEKHCIGEPIPNPAIEKWMDNVSNAESRGSAQSAEREKDIIAFHDGGYPEEYWAPSSAPSWSSALTWSSGEEDLEVSPVTREESREMRRRDRARDKGKGKEKA